MKIENNIAFWGGLAAATLFFVIMVLPIFSYAMTTDQILCNCRNFMIWRGHEVPEQGDFKILKSGAPPVGSVAVWWFHEKGYGHVAEVVATTTEGFWTIGSNEGWCGLFLRFTRYTDFNYQGWLK